MIIEIYATPTGEEEPRMIERIDPAGDVATDLIQDPVIREWADGLQIGGEDALPEHSRDIIVDFEQFREDIYDSFTRVATLLTRNSFEGHGLSLSGSSLSGSPQICFGLRAYHPETNTAEIEVELT